LSKENGSLKQNLDATNAAMNASRSESAKALSNGVNVHKVLDLLPIQISVCVLFFNKILFCFVKGWKTHFN
jgi:hypothetical protein